MDGVLDRSAAFHCAAAFAKPDGFELVVEEKGISKKFRFSKAAVSEKGGEPSKFIIK